MCNFLLENKLYKNQIKMIKSSTNELNQINKECSIQNLPKKKTKRKQFTIQRVLRNVKMKKKY